MTLNNPCLDILVADDATQDRIAIVVTAERRLSYRELRRASIGLALKLLGRGVDSNSCVAIESKNSLSSVIAILAVGLLGASWVNAVPVLWRDRKVKVTHLLSPNASLKVIFSNISWIELTDEMAYAPADYEDLYRSYRMPDYDQRRIWFFAQSSGTTGQPKFIGLSYENYSLRNGKANLTHDFNPVITACLFPALSSAWVSYNLRTLAEHGTWVMGSNIRLFAEQNVQKVFGSPIQFEQFFAENSQAATKKIPIAHVAGAKPPKALTERILESFVVIHNFYGSVEVGGIARNVIEHIDDDRQCVGRILDGNEVRIVDEGYAPVVWGVEGLIGVRNSIMAVGYFDDAESTARCFRDGYFYSGDRGYFNQDGQLYLTARTSDIVNLGGMKVALPLFDDMLASQPGVKDGLCFTMPNTTGEELLMAMIVLSGTVSADEAVAILRKYLLSYPKFMTIRGIFIVEAIPRNENGKAMRKDALEATLGLQPTWLFPFSFNGKEYDSYSLSAKAQGIVRMLQEADRSIGAFREELAIASTARNAYADTLQLLLPS